jgi:hypothetical protein
MRLDLLLFAIQHLPSGTWLLRGRSMIWPIDVVAAIDEAASFFLEWPNDWSRRYGIGSPVV